MRQLPGLVHGPITRTGRRGGGRDIVRINYRAFVSGNKVSWKEMIGEGGTNCIAKIKAER